MKTRRFLHVTLLAGAVALVLPFPANAAEGGPSEGQPEGQAHRDAGRQGEYINDTIINARVTTALANVNGIEPADIKVETRDGLVHITGFVASQSANEEAMIAVRQIDGVRDVKNEMVVRPRK
ncbi:BON domain-containing protein [Aromatoleum sp.]|uniref:BON domain-containing protein n=1 Tax=Aromatoleum sp. TaxID=2307007 RepID=UPI002FC87940